MRPIIVFLSTVLLISLVLAVGIALLSCNHIEIPDGDCTNNPCHSLDCTGCLNKDSRCVTSGQCQADGPWLCRCKQTAGGVIIIETDTPTGGTLVVKVSSNDTGSQGMQSPQILIPPPPGGSATYFFDMSPNTNTGALTLLPDCQLSGAAARLPTNGIIVIEGTRRTGNEENIIDIAYFSGGVQAASFSVPCFGPTGPNQLEYVSLSGTFNLTTNHVSLLSTLHVTNNLFGPQDPLILKHWSHGQVDLVSGIASLKISGAFILPATIDANGDNAPDTCNQPVEPIYVDSQIGGGANNGSSWANAFVSIQDALAAATVDTSAANAGIARQIWVAGGVYKPAPVGGSRTGTFRIGPGMALYGGFSGGETSIEERDFRANTTILSGDLNGDDGPAMQNSSDNAFHVVTITETLDRAILDGFIIQGGNADGPAPLHDRGGGLYRWDSKSLIRNCLFRGNYASDQGGAIYSSAHSAGEIAGSTFVGNSSGRVGGALRISQTFFLTVRNCRFLGNHAEQLGGAIGSNLATVTYHNCLFSGNSSGGNSGAAISIGGRGTFYNNCTFTNNTAPAGAGGAVFASGSDLRITNSILWMNSDMSGTGENAQAHLGVNSVLTINNSCVQGWSGVWGGSGNIGLDPIFVDPIGPDLQAGTMDDDLRLSEISPCMDAGDETFIASDSGDLDLDCVYDEPIPVDVAGKLRFNLAALDMGAHEFGADDVSAVLGVLPTMTLRNAAPNPFNPRTTISYSLVRPDKVRLTIHDIRGYQIVTLFDDHQMAGDHEVVWSGKDGQGKTVSSGNYIIRLDAGGKVATEKIVLLK